MRVKGIPNHTFLPLCAAIVQASYSLASSCRERDLRIAVRQEGPGLASTFSLCRTCGIISTLQQLALDLAIQQERIAVY